MRTVTRTVVRTDLFDAILEGSAKVTQESDPRERPYLHPTKGWRGLCSTKPRSTNKRRKRLV